MVFVVAALAVTYIAFGFVYHKHNRLTIDLIDTLVEQNELLSERNALLVGIIKKYGIDT